MNQVETFQLIETFSWKINRAERSHQVRWLAPLLDQPEGRAWFLEQLQCPCTPDEARAAEVFHLCFPLRDLFSADYEQCRGRPHLEAQFIAHYNRLFCLPEDFGITEVWRTAPDGQIRHPGARGRAGWYDAFLRERVSDDDLFTRARDVRRMLDTEADVFLPTGRHVILVECKYRGVPSTEQYERHQMMGKTLARRLDRALHFGLVVDDEHDPHFARFSVPYLFWSEIRSRLEKM